MTKSKGVQNIQLNYSPHTRQQEFHMMDKRIRLVLSGIRGGKTWAGIAECMKLAFGGGRNFGTPNVGCVVAPTYTMIKDIIYPALEELVPSELIKKFNHTDNMITLINGSVILFRSAEYPEKLRGLSLHWFWGDEIALFKEGVYKILLGRIAQKKGCGFMTTTTKGYNWVYDEIYEPWETGKDKDIGVLMFSSYENPHFPQDEIDRLKGIYTEQFFEQEIMARFIKVEGLIFTEFNRAIHVKPLDPKRILSSIGGIDFGFSNPNALVILSTDVEGNFYVVDEFFKSNILTYDLVAPMRAYSPTYLVSKWFADPSEPGAIASLKNDLFDVVAGNNSVHDGINKINELFKTRKLFICPNCKNVIRELESYHYRKGTDNPVKVDDHLLDASRYAIMSSEPVPESTDYVMSA